MDPLDGTTNFVHAFPFVCVSIGLAINKQVVAGVVSGAPDTLSGSRSAVRHLETSVLWAVHDLLAAPAQAYGAPDRMSFSAGPYLKACVSAS